MNIKNYLQDSLKDFNSVTWPTRKQAIRISSIVFAFMMISAITFGLVDHILLVGYKFLLTIH